MNRVFVHAISLALALLAGATLASAQAESATAQAESATAKEESAAEQAEATAPATTEAKPAHQMKVMVIPVREAIDEPVLYIVRRGLKEAIKSNADTVILDMKTPGGRLDVTLEIMEAIDRFPGKTITYVNSEATSAGAIIASVTDEIYLAPRATIGSSEAVNGSGQDLGESMKRKLNSYLGAKIRSYTDGTPYRADVIRAMMDPDFEFKIGDKVINPKGELLNLTAKEALETYGDPPHPLLGAGISETITDLLNQIYGEGNYVVERVEPSWSEDLAQYLTFITPALLAFGLLGLFIEFKTPGFGIFGITGITLLAVVFFGHHVAGLSGYEPMLVLLLGIILIGVEVFLMPGTIVPGILGAVLILISLVWAMLDIWPEQPLEINGEVLMRPMFNLTLGAVGAAALFLALLRLLPSGGPWGGMILQTAVGGEPNGIHPVHFSGEPGRSEADLVGSKAVAATGLYPSGQVTIAGKRYEARLEVGSVAPGAQLLVKRASQFGLIVEEVESSKEVKS